MDGRPAETCSQVQIAIRLANSPASVFSLPRDTPGIFQYAEGMAGDQNESLKERAPLLLVFGDLAPRVAALVRARPILITRLVMAPREAIHSIGAFLHLAPSAAGPDADVAMIINGTDPRKLDTSRNPAASADEGG